MPPSATHRPKAAFLLQPTAFEQIFGDDFIGKIAPHVALLSTAPFAVADVKSGALHDVELLFGGWGTPALDAELLEAMPALRVVFYGAGSIKGVVTADFWRRNITITSAAAANAVSTAEYSLAVILFSLKHGWRYVRQSQVHGKSPIKTEPLPGIYKTKVGLVSLGAIGRHVAQLLRNFEVQVLAFDPYLSPAEAHRLGVELVDLPTLFASCQVVSCHTPALPETNGLLGREHFTALPPGATFINTARGMVVRHSELEEALLSRPDLTAFLDVTEPEPLPANSKLLELENVFLTPHIAGATDGECRRLGAFIREELEAYLNQRPLKGKVLESALARIA